MKIYITIDGGTTNTRVSIVKDRKAADTVKLPYGAKAGIENSKLLKNGIRDAVSRLLESHCVKSCDVECILASGMITSEFGFYNLAHIETPVGIAELNSAAKKVYLPEICDIPFVFLCGVKTGCDSLHTTDMMRGEETELFGLCDEIEPDCAYLLPGSHSKLIFTDSLGRITSFTTFLTGEMAAALSGDTILKDSVFLDCGHTESEYLFSGYEYCRKYGINESLFKARILKNIFSLGKEEIYSFFMGAVLEGEIIRVIESDVKKITVGGKKQLREQSVLLLKKYSGALITDAGEDAVQSSVINGMIKIYEYRQ